MSFFIIIPARFASTRLPIKPLTDINGKPMILHVIDKAKKSKAKKIIVATDHDKIFSIVQKYGKCDVCMTSKKHKSGTERLSEVIKNYSFSDNDKIVNLQSDEPMISDKSINKIVKNLNTFNVNISTLAIPIQNIKDLFNPNIVKVVINKKQYAIYFSRASIPWDINNFKKLSIRKFYLRHIGIYAYRVKFIKHYFNWKSSNLENIESLEQLRILWNDEKIHVAIENLYPYSGVDTLQDVYKVRKFLIKNY